MKRKQGFTIIELMIVLVIVAILLALAYPSYIDYVRKSKRGDAQQALMNWAVNQEIWRSNNPEYADETDIPAADLDHYDLSVVDGSVSATSYTLRADATGDQVNDTARDKSISCARLELNQNGQKTPAECWE